MSTGQVGFCLDKEQSLALLLSQHSRCGKDSPMNVLSRWALREIVEEICKRVVWKEVIGEDLLRSRLPHFVGINIRTLVHIDSVRIPNLVDGIIFGSGRDICGEKILIGAFNLLIANQEKLQVILDYFELFITNNEFVITNIFVGYPGCGAVDTLEYSVTIMAYDPSTNYDEPLDPADPQLRHIYIDDIVGERKYHIDSRNYDKKWPAIRHLFVELETLFTCESFRQSITRLLDQIGG